MSSDERLITERQRFQNGEDGEENIKYWNFFSQFLVEINKWREYKFVITTKVKQQYQWFKYSNLPANGMITEPGSTQFLIPCNTDDLQKICTKAEEWLTEDLFKFALPVVALGCYDPRSKIAKAIATHLTLQKPTNHRVETLHSTRVSVSKPKEVISFIPELKDFEAKYPSLTNLGLSKDDFLLWLYDQPERDMMALHIGRAASLPQGGVQAGETEPVEHSYRNVIILKGQPFVGKQLPNSEPVLTPNGWVTNGSLRVGDQVIGSNGLPTKILGVYPQGLKQVYEITFSDNSVVRCGLEHLWTVTYQKALKKPGVKKQRYDCTRTITTEQLIYELKKYPNRHFSIPSFTGLKASLNTCLEAWQLGYAYGNGCFTGGQFAVSCHIKDLKTVKAKFDAISNKEGKVHANSENGAKISYPWASLPKSFEALRKQGLNKVLLPDVYQLILEHQQLFFAGYFDADGSVCAKNGTSNFSCSNKILFDGLVSLGRSCGYLITERIKTDDRKTNASYRAQVVFNTINGFVIKQPQLPKRSESYKTFIKSVIKLDYEEQSTCISVDAKDHLYVTSNYKLTHNTWFNNWLIDGFESCGLTTSVIHDLGRQFGHAEWVGSAWSYLDDTTETMISHFFNSAVLKTVASNGLINAESKGVDHITVKAFTAPILLANNIDSRHLANCDEGNANRIKIVACKDLHGCRIAASEIKPGSPLYGVNSVIPAETFIHLANKAGVSAEVLSMYFIRLCLDYFESFSMQDLATKVNRISQELYETYVSNGMNILAKSAVLSYLLKHNLTNEEISLLQVKFSEAGNSAPFILDSLMSLADLDCRITYETQGLIKSLIKQHWLRTNKDGTHPWVTHRNYSTTLITKLGTLAESQKENLTRKGRDSVPLEKVYHAVFHELRDSAGNPSVYSISRVQDAWKAALILNFNYVIEIYYFIIDELAAINKLSTLKAFQDSAPLYHQVFTKLGVTASNPLLDLDDDYFINYVEPEASSIIAAADPRNRFKT